MASTKEPRAPRRPFREAWPAWREGVFILCSLLVSLAVASVTGWGSWIHIVHIGHSVGEPSADWLPVAIDGMMFNGTILVAVDRFRRRVARPWAVISLWLGSILTLTFNVASAYERGPYAMLIAVMYPVALLCTVEAVFHPSQTTIEMAMARRAAKTEAKKEAKAASKRASAPVVVTTIPAVAPVVVAAEPAPVEPAPVVTETVVVPDVDVSTSDDGSAVPNVGTGRRRRRSPANTSPGPRPSRAKASVTVETDAPRPAKTQGDVPAEPAVSPTLV